MSAATPANIIKLQRVLCLIWFVCLLASVHGPPAAAPDAGQAPARPDLPAARPPETHPPLHLHPMPVLGPPLDPQVHCGCHHLPCHGGKRLRLTDATAHKHSTECESWSKNFFSLQILALVAVRKAMDYVFSQHDLSYLDDVIPEKDKKKKEDEKKKKNKKKGSIDSEIDFVSITSAYVLNGLCM